MGGAKFGLYNRQFAWAIAGLILISFGIVFAYVSYEARQNTWWLGAKSAENVTRLAAQLIARDIEIYDLSLKSVVDDILDPEIMIQPPSLRAKALFDRAATAKGFGFINVADENGLVYLDSKAINPRKIDISARDYFLAHKKSEADHGLYISRPFRSKFANGRWTVALSRKIVDAHGAFKGTVSGYIAVDYLNDILQRALIGSDGVAAVMRDDGFLVARSVFDERLASLNWRSSTLLSALDQAPEGHFVKRSLDDGVNRLYVYQRIAGTSLAIATGIAVDHILGPWWSRTFMSGLIIAVLAAAVISLVVLLDLELTRRTTAEKNAQLLARTDPLTGIANRRMFDEHLEKELIRARRQRIFVSLLMIDVDWFKKYNDAYGHLQGDKVLVQIAGAIDAATRSHFDLVARFGGEEFAVVLLHEQFDDGGVFASRLVEIVRTLEIPALGSPFGYVTVSCGISTCGNGLTSPNTLMKEADHALYEAKAAGRNRFVRSLQPRIQEAA